MMGNPNETPNLLTGSKFNNQRAIVSTKGRNTRITAENVETALLGFGTVVGGAVEGTPLGAVGSF